MLASQHQWPDERSWFCWKRQTWKDDNCTHWWQAFQDVVIRRFSGCVHSRHLWGAILIPQREEQCSVHSFPFAANLDRFLCKNTFVFIIAALPRTSIPPMGKKNPTFRKYTVLCQNLSDVIFLVVFSEAWYYMIVVYELVHIFSSFIHSYLVRYDEDKCIKRRMR